jgi:hypothetical protein
MVKATCLPRTSKTKNVNVREDDIKTNISLSSQLGPNANVLLFVDLGGIMEEALLRHVFGRKKSRRKCKRNTRRSMHRGTFNTH